MLRDAECYAALAARDARFDGSFFVGVRTTGIYCRPICAARTPRIGSCRFFETAAGAEAAGFRPCLRCRPEMAPGRAAVSLEEALHTALRQRAVQGEGVEAVAERTGFSSRHLRRLMVQAYGVSPVEIVQTERLLFAKKLLQETTLPMVEVALSAGFGSLRRFNALFQARYGLAPTALRGNVRTGAEATMTLRLAYRPPLGWPGLLEYLARRSVPGVEWVDAARTRYARTLVLGTHGGWAEVHAPAGQTYLEVTLPAALAPVSWEVLQRLRALFDLDANPGRIDEALGRDALLGGSVARHPGLRVPGAWHPFELAVRAVLGQQVSVAGATTLAARLAAKFGAPLETPHRELHRAAVTAEALATAEVGEIAQIGLPQARAQTLRMLAEATLQGELEFNPAESGQQVVARLRRIRGIGEWTAQYIAMRGLRYPDAFPAADLGVRKALAHTDGTLPPEKEVLARAEAWRPWRAYATLHLWQTLHDQANS